MRRIYKFDDYDIGCGPYVTIHRRDYRLMQAVVRAAHAYEHGPGDGLYHQRRHELSAALDKFNAKQVKK
jgi:hypothetical protein